MENDGSVPAITVDQISKPCKKKGEEFTGESSMGNKKLNTETIIKELEGHIEYMKKLKETIGTTKDASIEAEIKNLEKMTEIMKGKVPGEDDKEAREAIESHVKMIREEGELKGWFALDPEFSAAMENDGSVPAITVDQISKPCKKKGEEFTGESSMGNKKLNTETIIKELECHIEYMKKLKETIGTTKDASIEAEIKNLEKMTEIMKGKVPGEDEKEAREAIESHVKMIMEEGELKGCMSWLM